MLFIAPRVEQSSKNARLYHAIQCTKPSNFCGFHLGVKAKVLTSGQQAFTTHPFIYPWSPWPHLPWLPHFHGLLQPYGPCSSLCTLGTLLSRVLVLVSVYYAFAQQIPRSSTSSAWVSFQMSSSQKGLPSPLYISLQALPLNLNSPSLFLAFSVSPCGIYTHYLSPSVD